MIISFYVPMAYIPEALVVQRVRSVFILTFPFKHQHIEYRPIAFTPIIIVKRTEDMCMHIARVL